MTHQPNCNLVKHKDECAYWQGKFCDWHQCTCIPEEKNDILIKEFHCSKHGYVKPVVVPKCSKCHVPEEKKCCEKCEQKQGRYFFSICGGFCPCHAKKEEKCLCGELFCFGECRDNV